MKKMYQQPEMEVLNVSAERLMDSMTASPQGSYQSSGSEIPEGD